ncbi:MAG: transposase, partial [Gammaproteobacteria bacterium]
MGRCLGAGERDVRLADLPQPAGGGRCALGLTPTPYSSGGDEREQGISKAGNARARAMLVELAWLWLRYQPDSALSQWFLRRFNGGGRQIGIVALARRSGVALCP